MLESDAAPPEGRDEYRPVRHNGAGRGARRSDARGERAGQHHGAALAPLRDSSGRGRRGRPACCRCDRTRPLDLRREHPRNRTDRCRRRDMQKAPGTGRRPSELRKVRLLRWLAQLGVVVAGAAAGGAATGLRTTRRRVTGLRAVVFRAAGLRAVVFRAVVLRAVVLRAAVLRAVVFLAPARLAVARLAVARFAVARFAVARLAVPRFAVARLAVVRLLPRTAVLARLAAPTRLVSSRATVFSRPASRFSSSPTGNAFTRFCTAFTRSPPAAGARRRAVVPTRLTVRLTAFSTPPLLRLVLAISYGPPCCL